MHINKPGISFNCDNISISKLFGQGWWSQNTVAAA